MQMLRRPMRYIARDLRETVGSNPVTVLVGVGLILVALVAMVTVTFFADNAANSRRDELSEEVQPFGIALGDLEVRVLLLSTDLRAYVLSTDPMFQQRYQERRASLVTSLSAVSQPISRDHFDTVTRAIVRDTVSYMSSADATLQAAAQGDLVEAERLIAEENTPRLDASVGSISVAQAEVQGEISRLQSRIREIDRAERAVLLLAGPLGVIAAAVLVWLALTNQRLLRSARTEQARFESMVDSVVRYGVFEVDRRGRFAYVSAAAERMLGYEREYLVGKDVHGTLHASPYDESPRAAADCALCHPVRSGAISATQGMFVRNDGLRVPVDVTSAPIVLNGAAKGAVVVFEDITHRMKQEQFRQQFLSFAAHELRTPLMIISGYVQMLAKRARRKPDNFDEQSLEAIGELEQGSARMRKITEVVLDLTRIQSGQDLRIETGIVDLKDLLDIAAASVRATHPEIGLEVEYPNGQITLTSDEDRLRQVVWNLLDNAAKYGGNPAKVRVRVDLDDSSVIVHVRDDGPGIPLEEQNLVFEQFYRSGIVADKPGLGVGLFITKRIVDGLGGSLSFESAQGKGTEFTLKLPAGSAEGASEGGA
jgi:PAS domain S-box-containing protein